MSCKALCILLLFLKFAEISGYLRNTFFEKKPETGHYYGAITDGQYKLDVLLLLNASEKITYTRGVHCCLIGELIEDGITFIFISILFL